jgi:putative tricarboxylic transport membrane protein
LDISLKQRELLVSAGIIALGLFCLFQANAIENTENARVSPALVPAILSWLLVGFGVLSMAYRLFLSHPDDEERVRVSGRAAGWVCAVTGLGLLYYFLFQAVGYLLASVLMLGLVLVAFGVRRPFKVVVLSVFGGLAFFLIFIRVLKVYDPPGSLIDISTFLVF